MWGWALVYCLLVSGERLKNAAMDVMGGSVPDWGLNSATVKQGNTTEGLCANVTGIGVVGCPDVYQIQDTIVTQRYMFSCYAYSKTHMVSSGFAMGLTAQAGNGYTCDPFGTPGVFINYTWFSPRQPDPPIWMKVDLFFVASSAKTVLMAHADNGQWACFKNCTFFPMTQSPTLSPTIPTQSPSTLSPTGSTCAACSVPVCSDLLIVKEPEGCGIVEDLAQVVSWTKSPFWSSRARNVICSIIQQESTQGCQHKLDRNLYIDACSTLRESLYPGFVNQFHEKWCFNATMNFSYPIQEWNTSLKINYTAFEHQAACVERQKYQSETSSDDNAQYVALGPLADVLANPEKYPDFPEIKRVQSSRTTGILYNTACLEPRAIAPGWYAALGIFLALAVGSGLLLFMRRKLAPVKARDAFLMWGGLFWVVVNFIWISIDQLTGNTASCGLISFGNLVAFPMLLFIYLLRALRLLFLYKWAESKVNNDAWFHAHRYLVRRNSFLILSSIFFVFCVIVFAATNVVDGTFSDTFLSSGRCEWWDFNQQVIEAASEADVPLLPTDFNPNGFVPYSVEYSSCVFCSTFSTQVLMCIITVLLLCLIVTALVLLRKINDQFKLLFELVGVLVALSVVAIIRSIMFFPASASSVMATVGSDLSAIFLAIILFFFVLISAIYPALLTYTKRYQVVEAKVTHMGGKINGTEIVLSLKDVLEDQFGLALYKQFALESFAVENVMYWCAYQDFKQNSAESVSQRSTMAQEIYNTFIRQGAVMEVNVQAPIREKYDKIFGGESTTYLGIGNYSISSDLASTISHEGTEVEAKALVQIPDDVFADVTDIVFGLMQTNCWLRFKKSPFWIILSTEMKERAADANPIMSDAGTQMSSLRSMDSFKLTHSMRSMPDASL